MDKFINLSTVNCLCSEITINYFRLTVSAATVQFTIKLLKKEEILENHIHRMLAGVP